MSPRKHLENTISEQDLIDFKSLADIFHQKADIIEKERIVTFLRGLICRYLSCVRIQDENAVKFQIIMVSRNSFAIIFQLISDDSKHDKIGTMLFSGAKIRGLPKNIKQKPKTFEESRKIPLVNRINIKLDNIETPNKGKYKVPVKKVRVIVDSPDAAFDIEI